MRLWTVHPKYLDPRGLVALWREALLAQKVLRGDTTGYKNHPQLARFRLQKAPVTWLARYLVAVHLEANTRGYHFDSGLIIRRRALGTISETQGQLLYEWEHLKRKLQTRNPAQFEQVALLAVPEPHPLFHIVPGGVRDWERVPQDPP